MAGLNRPGTHWHGWLPIRLWSEHDRWSVDWCRFDTQPLREPFFRDSVELALRRPFNQTFRRYTGIDTLLERHRRSPGLAPTAFVFHASRCGSTLLAQMLARLDSHVVLSEPPPLDALLRAHYRDTSIVDRQVDWIRALLSAYGQPRRGTERALVVKLDAWSIAELPLLRHCFPATPWLFLYRDPVEIVMSHLQAPGLHMVPGLLGASPLALPTDQAATLPRAEFVARTLGHILATGLEHCMRHGGLAVNYTELPGALAGRLAPLFALAPVSSTHAMAGARHHAKRPGERFEPDSLHRQQAADKAIRAQVERWAHAPYAALEALRGRQLMATATTA